MRRPLLLDMWQPNAAPFAKLNNAAGARGPAGRNADFSDARGARAFARVAARALTQLIETHRWHLNIAVQPASARVSLQASGWHRDFVDFATVYNHAVSAGARGVLNQPLCCKRAAGCLRNLFGHNQQRTGGCTRSWQAPLGCSIEAAPRERARCAEPYRLALARPPLRLRLRR